jgi:hypothetical protein
MGTAPSPSISFGDEKFPARFANPAAARAPHDSRLSVAATSGITVESTPPNE